MLARWPALSAPVAVHLNVNSTKPLAFTLPGKLLREAGLDGRQGVHIAVYKGRGLVWSDGKEGPYKTGPDGQFRLKHTGMDAAVTGSNFTVILGKGYLILTTKSMADKLAPNVPRVETKFKRRLDTSEILSTRTNLSIDKADIIAWKDIPDYHPNPRSPNRAFKLAGSVCRHGGFSPGDSVRIFKYENAAVVEKAGPELAHARFRAINKRGKSNPALSIGPRVYASAAGIMRVIALKGQDRLVLCEPSSPLGQLCDASTELVKNARELTMPLYPGNLKHMRGKAANDVAERTDAPSKAEKAAPCSAYPLKPEQSRVQVQGKWLRDFGFVPGARYDVKTHPLFKQRVLLELSDSGKYQVTTLTGTTPKLYVPMNAVRHFSNATHIRVLGSPDGLQVCRDLRVGALKTRGSVNAVRASQGARLKRAA
ncbi:hypothetical protein AS149_12695 [Burkholderia cenocepacia]|nr:hypothetical protein AS149_12695 [Burkholderia cenocepacia]